MLSILANFFYQKHWDGACHISQWYIKSCQTCLNLNPLTTTLIFFPPLTPVPCPWHSHHILFNIQIAASPAGLFQCIKWAWLVSNIHSQLVQSGTVWNMDNEVTKSPKWMIKIYDINWRELHSIFFSKSKTLNELNSLKHEHWSCQMTWMIRFSVIHWRERITSPFAANRKWL